MQKGPHIKLATPIGSWEIDKEGQTIPSRAMLLRLKTWWNISAMPSLVESWLAILLQPNQVEGVNGAGAEQQLQQRNLMDNANFFVEVLQLV